MVAVVVDLLEVEEEQMSLEEGVEQRDLGEGEAVMGVCQEGERYGLERFLSHHLLNGRP